MEVHFLIETHMSHYVSPSTVCSERTMRKFFIFFFTLVGLTFLVSSLRAVDSYVPGQVTYQYFPGTLRRKSGGGKCYIVGVLHATPAPGDIESKWGKVD